MARCPFTTRGTGTRYILCQNGISRTRYIPVHLYPGFAQEAMVIMLAPSGRRSVLTPTLVGVTLGVTLVLLCGAQSASLTIGAAGDGAAGASLCSEFDRPEWPYHDQMAWFQVSKRNDWKSKLIMSSLQSVTSLSPDALAEHVTFGVDIHDKSTVESATFCEVVEQALHEGNTSSIYDLLAASQRNSDNSGAFLHFNHRMGSYLAAHNAHQPILQIIATVAKASKLAMQYKNEMNLPQVHFDAQGTTHGVIWQSMALSDAPDEDAMWRKLDEQGLLDALYPDFTALLFSIHGVGHGFFLRALMNFTSFKPLTCKGLRQPWADAPVNSMSIPIEVPLAAEEACLRAPRQGPQWASSCIDGMFHTLWETVPICKECPWTHYCGHVRFTAACLISRYYMEIYGGALANSVGPVDHLAACVDEPDATDQARLGCVQMVGFTQFLAYDEALHATSSRGSCHSAVYGSRTSTTTTGVAFDLLDDEDAPHLPSARPEGAAVDSMNLWCSKVVRTNVNFAMNRERWLVCVVATAAGVMRAGVPESVRFGVCRQLRRATWTTNSTALDESVHFCKVAMATGCTPTRPEDKEEFSFSEQSCYYPAIHLAAPFVTFTEVFNASFR